MRILIVKFPIPVYEFEHTVVIVPEHITVILVGLIEIYGTLNNIPDVITGSFCKTGSINPCAVGAFPEEFGVGCFILVYSAVERCKIDTETRINLGKLGNLSPTERRITCFTDTAHFTSYFVA